MRKIIDITTAVLMYAFALVFILASIDAFKTTKWISPNIYLNFMLFVMWWALIYVIWAGIKDKKK